MLYYDRIDVSDGIDVSKRGALKECDICHYWYFLDKKFKFQPNVCDGSHDLLMMSININNIAILKIRSVSYRCNINGIIKSQALHLLRNADLTKGRGVIQK